MRATAHKSSSLKRPACAGARHKSFALRGPISLSFFKMPRAPIAARIAISLPCRAKLIYFLAARAAARIGARRLPRDNLIFCGSRALPRASSP
jgi:hypothetical protein